MATLASYLPDFGALLPECARPLPAVAEDPAIALAAAEERGYRRGEAEAERMRAAERAEEQTRFESSLAESRRLWADEEGHRLAEMFAAAFEARTEQLAEQISSVLIPFLGEATRERALDELRAMMAGLLADEIDDTLTVTGPGDLLRRLSDSLGARAAGIDFVPADGVDVRVLAGSTVVETRIGAWLRRLEDSRV